MDDYIGSYREAPTNAIPSDQSTKSWADAFAMPQPTRKDRKLLKLSATLAKALPSHPTVHTAATPPHSGRLYATPTSKSASDSDDQIQQLPELTLPPVNSFGPGWVLNNIATTVDRCMLIEPVYSKRHNRGRPQQLTGEYKFNPSGALKALDLLARSMGMFTDKIEVAGSLKTTRLDELDKRIQALVTEHPSLRELIVTPPAET